MVLRRVFNEEVQLLVEVESEPADGDRHGSKKQRAARLSSETSRDDAGTKPEAATVMSAHPLPSGDGLSSPSPTAIVAAAPASSELG
jgi:hypothetical protein